MRDPEYCMNTPSVMEIITDQVDGGYTAFYPNHLGCIPCTETFEESLVMLEDAKRC